MMTGVSAKGRLSLRLSVADFFCMGMIVADFRQDGMMACVKEWLKMVMMTTLSCHAPLK